MTSGEKPTTPADSLVPTVDLAELPSIDLAEIASEATPEGEARPPTLPEIGLAAFRWVVVATIIALALLAGFAVLTYPRLEDVERIAGAQTALVTHEQLVDAWFGRIKELGQLFILTPLLPLFGLILGYIFGRSKGTE